jgi:triphosphoribosyl-dephospho-CoA synthetase
MWGNTLDYKLFNTLYLTHRYHARTIKKLQEQAKALLEEADKSTNKTRWLDMKSRPMYKLLLGPTFNKGSKNPNESKSLSLLLHSLAHLDDPNILI